VVLLTMIVGIALAAPCHGADQSAPWQAAVVAGSGTAAAEHANQLMVYGDADDGKWWDSLSGYMVGRLELIGVEDLRLDDLSGSNPTRTSASMLREKSHSPRESFPRSIARRYSSAMLWVSSRTSRMSSSVESSIPSSSQAGASLTREATGPNPIHSR